MFAVVRRGWFRADPSPVDSLVNLSSLPVPGERGDRYALSYCEIEGDEGIEKTLSKHLAQNIHF